MNETKLPEMTLADLERGVEGRGRAIEANEMLVNCGLDPMFVPPETLSSPWPRVEQPRNELPLVCWHIVHSANPSDKAVEMALKNAGYAFYYPKTVEMKPVPRRQLAPKQRNSPIPILRRTQLPLFARYFFVHFDWRDGRWHSLFDLMGVQGILCSEDEGKLLPCPVPDVVVAALRAKEENGLIPGTVTVRDLAFEVGEKVRIKSGPFFGFNGDVTGIPDKPLEQLDGSERLGLLVALFGRATPVELTLADVEKL